MIKFVIILTFKTIIIFNLFKWPNPNVTTTSLEPLECPELAVVRPAERCVAVAAGLDLADALAE